MQVKIKRSQRNAGLIGNSMRFSVYARAEFTQEERASIKKYELGKLLVYQDPKTRGAATAAMITADGTVRGDMRSMGMIAVAAMGLNIRVRDLEDGKEVECKSLDEVIGAEDAIIEACNHLDQYLKTAATFDGREMTFAIGDDGPELLTAVAGQSKRGPTAQITDRSNGGDGAHFLG